MSRYLTRGLQVVIDLAVLTVAYWAAFLFRFEFSVPPGWVRVAVLNWPYVILIQYTMLALLGVPNHSWRYVSMREMLRIGVAVTLWTGVLVALRLGLEPF